MVMWLNDLQSAIIFGEELFYMFCRLIVHYIQFWLKPLLC